MAVETILTPYEIMFRFNEDGTIKGAHIGLWETLQENGNIVSKVQKNVQSVAMAQTMGFPIEQVSQMIDTALWQDNVTKSNTITEQNIALLAIQNQVTELEAQIVELQEQNANTQASE